MTATSIMKKFFSLGLMLCGLVAGSVCHAACIGDTIPLYAQQTAARTVELTWTAGGGPTTVFRQYPGEEQPAEIGTTESSSWTDHQRRCVCGDTVRYSIFQGSDEGYAVVMVTDNEPTDMAQWGVVTVEDEQVRLRWKPSNDIDIMGYLVCEGNPRMVIDTVFGRGNTEYNYTLGDVLTPHYFTLCAFDSCRQASPLTEVCNNLVLELAADPCSRMVQTTWNAYQNMPSGVGHYELWVAEDGEDFRLAENVDAESRGTAFEVSASCMSLTAYVRVVSADGQSVANSNRVSMQFSTTERPAYFYLRKVSVSDDGKGVNVVAQTDPTFPGTDYRIYRTIGGRSASVVAHPLPSSDGTLSWHDSDVRPADEPCGYFLGVVDGCGRNEMRTATGYTILPELVTEGGGMVLRWNPYGGWSGTTEYQVISSPLDVDAWQMESNTQDSEYLLPSEGALRRYKVLAYEGPDSEFGRGDSLQSVEAFHRPHTDIWMPNAFTPSETSNNKVQPSAQYINPKGYSFMVFNRQGVMLFSTTATDGAWDGRYRGVLQPAGTYIYKIEYSQNDGTEQYLIGTVTIIR